MPATELAAMNGQGITGMTFYLKTPATGSWGAANFYIFMKEVGFTTFNPIAYSGTTGATVVYQGALDGTQPTMTVNFTTLYHYNGGNLLIGVYNTVKGTYKGATFYGENVDAACVRGYSYSSLDEVAINLTNFLPETTFTYGEAIPGTPVIVVTPDTVQPSVSAMYRPNGYWMRPFSVNVANEGNPAIIRSIDVQDNPQGFFVLEEMGFPFNLDNEEDIDVSISTDAYDSLGLVESHFVVAYDGRVAKINNLMAYAYDAVSPDVFEQPRAVSSFPYTDTPDFNAPLYDNYLLPGDSEDTIRPDAVYKLTITKDMVLNGNVENGENPLMAIYTEDFNGEDGPGANNAYTGLAGRSGEVLSEDFESGEMPEGWTTIDADGDGETWEFDYLYDPTGSWPNAHNNSDGMASSFSWILYPLNPDNYLVTPELDLPNGGTLTYFVCAQDADYPDEHYGIFASNSGNTAVDLTNTV